MATRSTRPVPSAPSLEHDRKQAKALLKAWRAGAPEALSRVVDHHPRGRAAEPKLAEAQLIIAREYGFASWPHWKQFVEMCRLDRTQKAAALVRLVCSSRITQARVLLETDPSLAEHDVAAMCACGRADAVRRWLESHAAQVNETTGPNGWVPLEYACFSRFLRADPHRAEGIVECAGMLLAASADPNAFHYVEYPGHGGEQWKQTALLAAAAVANHPTLTRLLLDAGADVNEGLGEPDGTLASLAEVLYHASEFRDLSCLRMLLEATPHRMRVSSGLRRMLDFEHHEGVMLYLQHGADPDFRMPLGDHRTNLQAAIANGRRPETVAALINYGADVNAADDGGVTALGYAIRFGHGELASLLIARGADASRVDKVDHEGVHPDRLCYAVKRGDVIAMEQLLERGADVNGSGSASGDVFLPPLHWACCYGRLDAVKLLVERGADVNLVNGYGGNALGSTIWGSANCFDPEGGPAMKMPSEAITGPYDAIAEMLITAGARLPDRIWGGSDAVQELLRRHGVPDAEDDPRESSATAGQRGSGRRTAASGAERDAPP